MNILDAVYNIGNQLNVSSAELLAYMDEDTHGGYHVDPRLAKWHIGSMWAVEAQLIYAIVRAIKPAKVLEIGVNYACSTTHILAALNRNKHGYLHSVDIENPKDTTLIPSHLQDRWTFHLGEGCEWITQNTQDFDLVLEDAGHDLVPTTRILRAVKAFLNPRVVISHDTEHKVVGAWVSEAFRNAFGNDWSSYLIEPSDCGLGLWVRQ